MPVRKPNRVTTQAVHEYGTPPAAGHGPARAMPGEYPLDPLEGAGPAMTALESPDTRPPATGSKATRSSA